MYNKYKKVISNSKNTINMDTNNMTTNTNNVNVKTETEISKCALTNTNTNITTTNENNEIMLNKFKDLVKDEFKQFKDFLLNKDKIENPENIPIGQTLTDWNICGESVVGLAHRRRNEVCQDAIYYANNTRPILVLSDGAGSGLVSELGSKILTIGMCRFFNSLNEEFQLFLDNYKLLNDEEAIKEKCDYWSLIALNHAKGLLEDTAILNKRNIKDLRGTLLFVIVGKYFTFHFQLGDGAIIYQNKNEELKVILPNENSKGEFANQTIFVDEATINDIQSGVLLSNEINAIALMSDGITCKLVSTDGSKVAGRINTWFDLLANDNLTRDQLTSMFYSQEMSEKTNYDDRSIILATIKKAN